MGWRAAQSGAEGDRSRHCGLGGFGRGDDAALCPDLLQFGSKTAGYVEQGAVDEGRYQVRASSRSHLHEIYISSGDGIYEPPAAARRHPVVATSPW